MKRLLRFELTKLLYRPRTYLSLGLMFILVFLIFWGLKSEGDKAIGFLLNTLEKNFILNGNILNGYLVCYIILNTLWIHVPVLVVIVTGDLFSSEMETGTIRLVLSRPVSRLKFILSKQLTAIFFVFLFLTFWGLIALWPALGIFGSGDLVVLIKGIQIIEENDLLWRFLCAFAFAFLGMGSFAVFSVTVSVFTRRSLVAIMISLGVLVISTLLQTFSISLFKGWQGFLLTYHLAQWQLLFSTTPDWDAILTSVLWLIGFSVICVLASLLRFRYLKITE